LTGDAVTVRGLRRSYRRRTGPELLALAGIDLDVAVGEVHGLLGPNGAGKTTLCKILSTVLLPTAGSATVLGHDVVSAADAVRRRIGIVFGGERGLYTRLTARQNLEYWAALYRVPRRQARDRVSVLLNRVGLTQRADERVETFSRGMKQRLHLARGLVGDPRVLLLDEPTVGMDPVAAQEFRVLVDELRAEGRTVLMATHDMAEAEALCDRVSLIDGGRLLATESPVTIGRWLCRYERVDARGVPDAVADGLHLLPGVARVHRSTVSGTVRVETNADAASRDILRHLLDAGVTDLATSRPSLEEVYLDVIGGRGWSLR
jgi:ABC-2 type transport system ATP-binding protein